VRLAAEFLDPHAPVLVGACDNTHLYNRQSLADSMAREDVVCLVWTYRGEPRVQIKPSAYGYSKTFKNSSLVEKVFCKVPISNEPIKDHVVSGFFFFQSAQIMNDAIDKMVASNERVNNEFYMDTVPNVLISDGHKVEVFEVEKYIGWGTPEDYEDFLKWEKYCANID
jgi:bifunctional N-acetylglucosamine-1-phosphate-uridyltransferase/glucosamine-1-phosphate-acetyltransferase GlmU-like protein